MAIQIEEAGNQLARPSEQTDKNNSQIRPARLDSQKEKSPVPTKPNDHKKEAVAAIDVETGLPVQLVYGTTHGVVTRTYQFQPAPELLILPADAQAVLDAHLVRMKRLSRPLAIP